MLRNSQLSFDSREEFNSETQTSRWEEALMYAILHFEGVKKNQEGICVLMHQKDVLQDV